MADLQTMEIPASVGGDPADIELGRQMIGAWRSDGIFQVRAGDRLQRTTHRAFEQSRRFFKEPAGSKTACLSDLTYSGYVATGEEVTAGERDHSEIFTVCPDIPPDDPRVRGRWPCHGPVPWPSHAFKDGIMAFMDELGSIGHRLLQLAALGLGLPDMDALTRLTARGWHHMRILRFPARSPSATKGIGAHTDYGLLVIAAQDDVGGLYIRPPVPGEARKRNWLPGESSAGMYEHDEPWTFVRPVPRVVTVFPGDILQFMTAGYLLSTPHKVKLNTRERYALAYFHEPGFETTVRPLWGTDERACLRYGPHFTRMFMRCYPDRVTTRRIVAENRLTLFESTRPSQP